MTTIFDPILRSAIDSSDICYNEASQRLRVSGHQTIPALMSLAPTWSAIAVVELKLQEISLEQYKEKYLIMLFYPYDFTFICPTEMIQFSDRIEEFDKYGCQVIAISTDSPYAHLAWTLTPRKQGGLGSMNIPILSDKNHNISKLYGVLDAKEGISQKALFVIDKNQLIRYIMISEMCTVRSVDETLRILETCKFVDEYGSVCPAGPREKIDDNTNYFTT